MSNGIRSDLVRSERNLRENIRFGGYKVQVYAQDVIEVLDELDRLRREVVQATAAAVSALEQDGMAPVLALPARVKAAGR